MTAEHLEMAAAGLWIVAAVVEIFVRRYEHRQVLRLMASTLSKRKRS